MKINVRQGLEIYDFIFSHRRGIKKLTLNWITLWTWTLSPHSEIHIAGRQGQPAQGWKVARLYSYQGHVVLRAWSSVTSTSWAMPILAFRTIHISFSGTCWLILSRHSLECCMKRFLSAACWQNIKKQKCNYAIHALDISKPHLSSPMPFSPKVWAHMATNLSTTSPSWVGSVHHEVFHIHQSRLMTCRCYEIKNRNNRMWPIRTAHDSTVCYVTVMYIITYNNIRVVDAQRWQTMALKTELLAHMQVTSKLGKKTDSIDKAIKKSVPTRNNLVCDGQKLYQSPFMHYVTSGWRLCNPGPMYRLCLIQWNNHATLPQWCHKQICWPAWLS